MIKTQYCCDICYEEKWEPIINDNIQVIFVTEQNEGRSCPPHLIMKSLDLCNNCYENILKGNYVFGSGAQGFNKYWFKKE